MSDDMYESLVQAGITKNSDSFSFDYNGPIKTHFHVTHSEKSLVTDEVGSIISQEGDGHIAGRKYIPREQASYNDKHFT